MNQPAPCARAFSSTKFSVDVNHGKIDLFGLDALVNMIGAAALHIEMRVSDAT